MTLAALDVFAIIAMACGGEPVTPVVATPSVTPSPTTSPGTPTPLLERGFAVRLRYEHILCGGGFPSLLIYRDGTVISPGVVGCPLQRRASEYHVDPERVQEILDRLSQLGVFDMVSSGVRDRDVDAPTVILEADDGARAVQVTGWRDDDPMAPAVAYLATVVESLTGGIPYTPDQILLHSERVTPENRRPGYAPKEWALAGVIDLAEVDYEARVDYAAARPLAETLEPWTLSPARISPGVLYWVWWRPLFPHEAP